MMISLMVILGNIIRRMRSDLMLVVRVSIGDRINVEWERRKAGMLNYIFWSFIKLSV